MRREERIEALRKSAQSERRLGNIGAADAFDAKANAMEHSLVPVKVNSVTDARRWVEQQWEKLPSDTRVICLCIESGLSRAVRRELSMKEALPLLKAEKARLLGRADAEWVLPPQQDTSNTPPLNQKPSTTLFI